MIKFLFILKDFWQLKKNLNEIKKKCIRYYLFSFVFCSFFRGVTYFLTNIKLNFKNETEIKNLRKKERRIIKKKYLKLQQIFFFLGGGRGDVRILTVFRHMS